MTRFALFLLSAVFVAALGGCEPDYSPNTYAGAAVQQANKVDEGIVIGFREVKISDDGAVGAVTGGAAGGILAAQTDSPVMPTALTALGGTVVGGIVGASIEHVTGDTTGWEYIVRESKGDLISVTQREPKPIPLGQKVLVIEGKQARIVADYAAPALETPPPAAEKPKSASTAPAPAATTATSTATTTSATAVFVPLPPATAAATATPTPATATAIPASATTAPSPAAPSPASSQASAPAPEAAPAAPTPPATSASGGGDSGAGQAKGPS